MDIKSALYKSQGIDHVIKKEANGLDKLVKKEDLKKKVEGSILEKM